MTHRPKPSLPFEFCPAPESRLDIPPRASKRRRALCREQPQGGSRGPAAPWGSALGLTLAAEGN